MRTRLTIVAAVLFLAAACSSGTLGSLGDILGSSGPSNTSNVTGTVTAVDTANQRVDLNVGYVNGLRTTSQGNSSIYYDSQTVVQYQGNTYRPEDLERGDQVTVEGYNSNGRYLATRITVTRNVRG